MREETFLSKIWNTLKPPPAVPAQRKPLNRPQRMLIRTSVSVVTVVAAALGTFYWIQSAPDRAESHFQTGMKYMRPGQYPQAVAEFGRAVSAWDRHSQAYLHRGIARQILGDQEGALADYEQASLLDPGLAEAFTARGTILSERGDVAGAIKEITKSIAVKATMDGYYQRGQLWDRLGEHQKAIDDFDRAIAEERDAPFVYRARSIAKRALGDLAGYQEDRNAALQLEYKR